MAGRRSRHVGRNVRNRGAAVVHRREATDRTRLLNAVAVTSTYGDRPTEARSLPTGHIAAPTAPNMQTRMDTVGDYGVRPTRFDEIDADALSSATESLGSCRIDATPTEHVHAANSASYGN